MDVDAALEAEAMDTGEESSMLISTPSPQAPRSHRLWWTGTAVTLGVLLLVAIHSVGSGPKATNNKHEMSDLIEDDNDIQGDMVYNADNQITTGQSTQCHFQCDDHKLRRLEDCPAYCKGGNVFNSINIQKVVNNCDQPTGMKEFVDSLIPILPGGKAQKHSLENKIHCFAKEKGAKSLKLLSEYGYVEELVDTLDLPPLPKKAALKHLKAGPSPEELAHCKKVIKADAYYEHRDSHDNSHNSNWGGQMQMGSGKFAQQQMKDCECSGNEGKVGGTVGCCCKGKKGTCCVSSEHGHADARKMALQASKQLESGVGTAKAQCTSPDLTSEALCKAHGITIHRQDPCAD